MENAMKLLAELFDGGLVQEVFVDAVDFRRYTERFPPDDIRFRVRLSGFKAGNRFPEPGWKLEDDDPGIASVPWERRPPRELWREGLYVGPNGGCTPAGCYKVAVYRAGEGSVQISCPVRDLEE